MFRFTVREDFREIYSECYMDAEENRTIVLIPEDVVFGDYSESGEGDIKIGGTTFTNLIYD